MTRRGKHRRLLGGSEERPETNADICGRLVCSEGVNTANGKRTVISKNAYLGDGLHVWGYREDNQEARFVTFPPHKLAVRVGSETGGRGGPCT